MRDSLCGKSPCPRICVRVCHCPAGLARSRELAGMSRNRRLAVRGKGGVSPSLTPEYQEQVEFVSQARHYFGAINQPERRKFPRFYPTHNYRQAKPPFGHALKFVSTWSLLMAFLVFMCLVLTWGVITYGPSLTPSYEVPNVITKEY